MYLIRKVLLICGFMVFSFANTLDETNSISSSTENSSDFVKIANSVILDIVDKDRGRRLFEKAEDTAKTPEDVRKLKLNQNE